MNKACSCVLSDDPSVSSPGILDKHKHPRTCYSCIRSCYFAISCAAWHAGGRRAWPKRQKAWRARLDGGAPPGLPACQDRGTQGGKWTLEYPVVSHIPSLVYPNIKPVNIPTQCTYLATLLKGNVEEQPVLQREGDNLTYSMWLFLLWKKLKVSSSLTCWKEWKEYLPPAVGSYVSHTGGS